MTTVSVYDARASLSRLIDRALNGEEIVITRKGTPVVRLTPVAADSPPPPRKRPLGLLKGRFEIPGSFYDPLPDDIVDAFHGGPVPSREEGEGGPPR